MIIRLKILCRLWPIIILLLPVNCMDSLTDPTAVSSDSIKIGYIGTFPTQAEEFEMRRGAHLAVTEINEAGGIFGQKLELVAASDNGDAERSTREAERLIRDYDLSAIIGFNWSGILLTATPQATIPNDILVISPTATSPLITTLSDKGLVWRTSPSDAFQGKVVANYVYSQKNIHSAGIIYRDAAYHRGLAESFKAEFERLAGAGSVKNFVVYDDLDDYTTYDFAPKMAALFQNQPDLIYLVTYTDEGALMTHQAKSYVTGNYKPLFMGCDGNTGQSLLVNGEPTILEGMIGTLAAASISNPNQQIFVNNYVHRYGGDSRLLFGPFTYDAVYLIAYAMLTADSPVSAEIARQLRTVSAGGEVVNVNQFARGKALVEAGQDVDYEGASGSVDFDANGDVTSGTYEIWRIENGQFIQEELVDFP